MMLQHPEQVRVCLAFSLGFEPQHPVCLTK
jgi:hypothetical protein